MVSDLALGGSRVNVGWPTGAFVGTIEEALMVIESLPAEALDARNS